MLNRSTIWAVVFLAATFAAGIAVGAGGRALWVRHAAAAAPERPRGIDRMMSELNEELRLTPAQSDTVRAVLQRHWTKMSDVWEAVRPRFDTLRAEMDAEVSRHLTAEQQTKYRDHVTRYRHQRDQERGDSSGRKQ
jgi:Spy/CpxP family protein refolding chaperone